jgi:hypothetical protein
LTYLYFSSILTKKYARPCYISSVTRLSARARVAPIKTLPASLVKPMLQGKESALFWSFFDATVLVFANKTPVVQLT